MDIFTVIDRKTGEYPDLEDIALHEEWAKGLVYCDMEGFAIEEDGSLLLMDECDNSRYCPQDRFEIVWLNDLPRLIDFEEIDNFEVLFLEVKNVDDEDGLAPWVKTKSGRWFSPLDCSESIKDMRLINKEDYNVIARCWTKRPTNEQRKETPWDER